MTRYVVALPIAGAAHVCVAARDAETAIRIGYDVVRRPDIGDWWPRRRSDDFIAPRAAPARALKRTYEVSLPILGTAYVGVTSEDPVAAVEAAYAKARLTDLDDWRAVRASEPARKPSVALEDDIPADERPRD
jgi:hypothetical protein